MSNYTNFLAMVSTEFHKYTMENKGTCSQNSR